MKFLKHFLLILSFILIANLPAKAQDTLINYAGNSTAIIAGNTPFSFFAAGQPATNFYYYFNVTPQTAVTFYVTNFGTGNDAITLKTIYTGNPSATAPTVNSSQWAAMNTVLVASGGAGANGGVASTQALTINTHQTAILSSGITNATRVGINFSAAANNTDVLNVYAVFTPNGILGQSQVSGVSANGALTNNLNPVVIGGSDASNSVRVIRVDACSGSGLGECLVIYDTNTAIASLMSNGASGGETFNDGGGTQNGPLAVDVYDASTQFAHFNSAGTTNITTAGSQRTDLKRVTVNSGVAASTMAIWTNACTTGTLIAVIDGSTKGTLEYQGQLPTGLCVIVTGTADYTVAYK